MIQGITTSQNPIRYIRWTGPSMLCDCYTRHSKQTQRLFFKMSPEMSYLVFLSPAHVYRSYHAIKLLFFSFLLICLQNKKKKERKKQNGS